MVANLSRSVVRGGLSYGDLGSTRGGVCACNFTFAPIGFLFLSLNILLLALTSRRRVRLPTLGSSVLPVFYASNVLKRSVLVFFAVNVVTTTFDDTSSTLATLAASFYVSVLKIRGRGTRSTGHAQLMIRLVVSVLFTVVVLTFGTVGGQDIVSTVCVVTSCACNPLLNLFMFKLFAGGRPHSGFIPCVYVISPLLYFLASCLIGRRAKCTFNCRVLVLGKTVAFKKL